MYISDLEKMKVSFSTLWNGDIGEDSYHFEFTRHSDTMTVMVKAKYFNDPSPKEPKGYLMGLWEYEVAEVFFLNHSTKEYLELEFGPHGHYLALKFQGSRNQIDKDTVMNFEYKASIKDGHWTGLAEIPLSYFPEDFDKFNCYG